MSDKNLQQRAQIDAAYKWDIEAMYPEEAQWEKDLTEEKYEELAKAVIRLCEKEGTTLILHRFPEVVEHLGYDKLHLPLEMLKTMGRTDGLTLLGTSVHSVEDAKEAEHLGVDYIFAGNILKLTARKGCRDGDWNFLKMYVRQ